LGQLTAERDELASNEAALERELDLLRHQVRENRRRPDPAERGEEVLQRYALASNSRRLMEIASAALRKLQEDEDAALTKLAEVGRHLRDLERIDPSSVRMSDALHRGLAELEDLTSSLQRYTEDLELEPAELARLEERVSLFETLKRKYGGTLAQVVEFGGKAAERLEKIESRGAEIDRLNREIAAAGDALESIGGKLSGKRKSAAPKLAASITTHLRDLGFKKGDFAVQLTALKEAGPHGFETAEFLFAPNPGEPAKPLKVIASSGEISRVMLAVKSALAAQDTVSLLVFDEIDANVGGEIAHAVGAKMRSLGEGHQVICITHLPQVAAAAAEQFVVTKDFADERTVSRLNKVEGKTRVEEVARMLGGKSDSALAHAKTLLNAH
jgi:DNA repair protein RecN (Recombination protein N)